MVKSVTLVVFTLCALLIASASASYRDAVKGKRHEHNELPPDLDDDEELGSFYDLVAREADGNEYSFKQLEGKIVLIVNVASECGYTERNYRYMKEWHDDFKDQGFEILNFPCNQFGEQEPGPATEVVQFVANNYDGTWPVFEKVEVNGPNTHPVWKWLKKASGITKINWNFEKFLINRDGEVVVHFDTIANLGGSVQPAIAHAVNPPIDPLEERLKERERLRKEKGWTE